MKARLTLVIWAGIPLLAYGSFGPRYGGELRVGLRTLPASFEPRAPGDPAQALAVGLIHETLVSISQEGTLVPSLAQSWSGGEREWTLALSPGLTFHDSRSLTAEDAVRSLRRFVRGPSSCGRIFADEIVGGTDFRKGVTEDLPGLDATDPLHITVRWNGASALPLLPLASPASAITSPAGAGAGPFEPTVRIPGKTVALTAFSGHVRGRPYLDRIVLSPALRPLAAELQAGQLDLAEGEEGLQALSSTLLLILDATQPPLDRPEARTAVRAVVDRCDLPRLVPGSAAPGGLLGRDLLPTLPPKAPPREHPKIPGRLSLAVSREVPPLVSQRIVALLGSLGLQPEVTVLSSEGVREVKSGARLLILSPEVPEAGLVLSEVFSLLGRDATSFETKLAETAADHRRAFLEGVEAKLREETVAIPLGTLPIRFGSRGVVHGARVDLAGRLVLEDAWVEP